MILEKDKNLLVLGGADGMGNWLVRRVFGQAQGIGRITLLDTLPLEQIPNIRWVKEIKQLPKPIDAIRVDYTPGGPTCVWQPITTQSESPDHQLNLDEYDVVMLAVPERQIPTAVSNLFPLLKDSSWIFDICSSKQSPIEIMCRYAKPENSVVGTHPFYGPAVSDLVGQTMIMAKTSLTKPEHFNWQVNLYKERGALIVETTPTKHDFYTKYTQGLTHFSYFVLAETLKRAMTEGFSLEESFKFMTPPYAALAGFLGRIINTNPRIYAQIQTNPELSHIRDLFVDSAHFLAEEFHDSNEPDIAEVIEKIGQPFQERAVTWGAAISNNFVEANQAYYRLLHGRAICEQLTVIQVRDDSNPQKEQTHVGKLVSFDSESLLLRECIIRRNGKLIVVYGDTSQRGAQRLLKKVGMGLPKSNDVRIHHKRARVLSTEETDSWRETHLLHHELDIPIVTSETSQVDKLVKNIPLICPDVVSMKTRDIGEAKWLKHYGLTNQILHLTVYGDKDISEVQKQVLALLNGLGLHLHQEVL